MKELYDQMKANLAASSDSEGSRAQDIKYALENIKFLTFDPSVMWSPKLYFQNAIEISKEQVNYCCKSLALFDF